jgi:hypothetical protein
VYGTVTVPYWLVLLLPLARTRRNMHDTRTAAHNARHTCLSSTLPSPLMQGTSAGTRRGTRGCSRVREGTPRRWKAVGSYGVLVVPLRVAECAARPRGRACRASCAGAYVSGASGSNECPAGSGRIETEAACDNAAAAVDKGFRGAVTYPNFPRGCIYALKQQDLVIFNTDAVGAGHAGIQLLCAAAATTGAPRTDARARTIAQAAGYALACRAWHVKVLKRVRKGYSRKLKVAEKLLRARAASRMGRGRHCTAVRGPPEYGLCGAAL